MLSESVRLQNKRPALHVLGAISLIALLFLPTFSGLWQRWILWDQDLAHAIPTLCIIAYIFYSSEYLHTEKDSLSVYCFWLLLSFISSLCWATFYSINISILSHICIFFCAIGLLGSIFSTAFIKTTFPIFILFLFCIPLWSELNPILVSLSAVVVGELVRLSQMTALIEGNSIHLPFGIIFIADGCSGLRYFTIAILMGLLLSIINQYNKLQTILAITIFTLLGLFANWVRIYALVLIGYETEMTSSLMKDHEMFGWVLFSALIFPAIYFSPVFSKTRRRIKIANARWVLPITLVSITPLWIFLTDQKIQKPLIALEQTALPSSNQIISSYASPKNVRLQQQYIGTYEKHAFSLSWFQPIDLSTNKGIVSYVGDIFGNGTNVILDQYQISISHKGKFTASVFRQTNDNKLRLAVYQYHVGNLRLASYKTAKTFQIVEIFKGNYAFGIFTLEIPCESLCEEEKIYLLDLLSHINFNHVVVH